MIRKTITEYRYVADDGRMFNTEEACSRYEQNKKLGQKFTLPEYHRVLQGVSYKELSCWIELYKVQTVEEFKDLLKYLAVQKNHVFLDREWAQLDDYTISCRYLNKWLLPYVYFYVDSYHIGDLIDIETILVDKMEAINTLQKEVQALKDLNKGECDE